MARGHQWEFEKGSGSPVQDLNIYRVDFLELLDQNLVVVGV